MPALGWPFKIIDNHCDSWDDVRPPPGDGSAIELDLYYDKDKTYSSLRSSLLVYGQLPISDDENKDMQDYAACTTQELVLLGRPIENWDLEDFELALNTDVYERLLPIQQLECELRGMQLGVEESSTEAQLGDHKRIPPTITNKYRKQDTSTTNAAQKSKLTVRNLTTATRGRSKAMAQLGLIDYLLQVITKPKGNRTARERDLLRNTALVVKGMEKRIREAKQQANDEALPEHLRDVDSDAGDAEWPVPLLNRIEKRLSLAEERVELRLVRGKPHRHDERMSNVAALYRALKVDLLSSEQVSASPTRTDVGDGEWGW